MSIYYGQDTVLRRPYRRRADGGNKELTHTELMEILYNNVKDTFEGGVQPRSQEHTRKNPDKTG